jgi:2-polyprenyl-3-methyl-5-hydroxy-6-metoxy-1,4-benzoquinol methylase
MNAALISENYAEQNRLLHASNPGYGRRGARHCQAMLEVLNATDSKSILDYGCGKGRFKAAMSSNPLLDIRNYDPAIPAFAKSPDAADLVLCSDVLEHIEPEKLDAVLHHIRGLAKKAAYIVVATKPDRTKTLPDGRNPHLIVHPSEWWMEKLATVFPVVMQRGETAHDSTFLVLQKTSEG